MLLGSCEMNISNATPVAGGISNQSNHKFYAKNLRQKRKSPAQTGQSRR